MTCQGRYRSAYAVLLLVPAAWLSASCDSDSDNDSDNQNSGPPPPASTLQLTISPDNAYAYLDQETDYEVSCNNHTLLPAEYVYFTRFVDQAGNAAEVYGRTHEDRNTPSEPEFIAEHEVQLDIAGDYTVEAKLFSTASLEVTVALDKQGLEELSALVEPTAEATAMLRVRDPGLAIKYTTDATGLHYTFTVEWTDSEYFNWYTRSVNADELSYSWYFGDTAETTPIYVQGSRIEHTYSQVGAYTVKVVHGFNQFDFLEAVQEVLVGTEGQTLSIVPPEGDLIVNTDSVFRAQYSAALPENPYYEWDFNDGTGTLGIPFSNEVTHAFPVAGSYTVSVSLFTEENGVLLATAGADVVVQPDHSARLLQAIKAAGFRASINAQHNFVNQDGSPQDFPLCNCAWGGSGCNQFYCYLTNEQIQWNGQAFSFQVNETLNDTPIDGVTRKRRVDVTGEISADAASLIALSVKEHIDDTNADESVRMSYSQAFNIADTALSSISGLSTFLWSTEQSPALPNNYQIQACVAGPDTQSHVDDLALDCLFYGATIWDFSYADSDWLEQSTFCVTFVK